MLVDLPLLESSLLFLTVIVIIFADEIALHETQHNNPGAVLFHMRANHWSLNRKSTNQMCPCTDERVDVADRGGKVSMEIL
jgi:CDP-diacylglycerol pyrophosphatase